MNENNLSPTGIAVQKIKKAALAFDKDVTSGIEYDMFKLIEEDARKRAKFDLKINLLKGMRELQVQYKVLYEDFAHIKGYDKDTENVFDPIKNNKESAYNKISDLINQLSNTTL